MCHTRLIPATKVQHTTFLLTSKQSLQQLSAKSDLSRQEMPLLDASLSASAKYTFSATNDAAVFCWQNIVLFKVVTSKTDLRKSICYHI